MFKALITIVYKKHNKKEDDEEKAIYPYLNIIARKHNDLLRRDTYPSYIEISSPKNQLTVTIRTHNKKSRAN